MLKILRIKDRYFQHVDLLLNRRIIQIPGSQSIHTYSQRENSNLTSTFHTTSLTQHNFRRRINVDGLLRRRILKLGYGSVRSFSELPRLPPMPIQGDGWVEILVTSPPVLFAQESLVWLHSTTGLPWWANLVLVTVLARTLITLPCSIYTQYIHAKTRNLKWEMEDIVKQLQREANYRVELGFTELEAKQWYNKVVREKWDELIVKENCHPAKGLVIFLTQLPLWIFLSAGTRNLCCMLPYPTPQAQTAFMQLTTEGCGWVTNLTVPDPYFILPILLGILNLCNVEFQYMMKSDHSTLQKVNVNILRGFTLILVPIAAVIPSAVTLYWTVSSAYGTAQNFLLVSPRVRRSLRIEWTDLEVEHPYTHLWSILKKRLPGGKIKKN